MKLYRDCAKKILLGKEFHQRMDKAIRIASDSVLYRNHMDCAVCMTRTCLWLCGGLFGLPEDNRTFHLPAMRCAGRAPFPVRQGCI